MVQVFCPPADDITGNMQRAVPVCPGGGLQVPADGVTLTNVVPCGIVSASCTLTPLSDPLFVTVMVNVRLVSSGTGFGLATCETARSVDIATLLTKPSLKPPA